MIECDCHEWYEVTTIGDWTQGSGGGPLHARPVREIVATDDIWERSETDRESLLAEVRAADGITCEYALLATTYLTIFNSGGYGVWSPGAVVGYA